MAFWGWSEFEEVSGQSPNAAVRANAICVISIKYVWLENFTIRTAKS